MVISALAIPTLLLFFIFLLKGQPHPYPSMCICTFIECTSKLWTWGALVLLWILQNLVYYFIKTARVPSYHTPSHLFNLLSAITVTWCWNAHTHYTDWAMRTTLLWSYSKPDIVYCDTSIIKWRASRSKFRLHHPWSITASHSPCQLPTQKAHFHLSSLYFIKNKNCFSTQGKFSISDLFQLTTLFQDSWIHTFLTNT